MVVLVTCEVADDDSMGVGGWGVGGGGWVWGGGGFFFFKQKTAYEIGQ